MKKILLILSIAILSICQCSYAENQDNSTVKFIYINGSNSNSEKAKDAYLKGFHSLHKEMKRILEQNETTSGQMLKNNTIDGNEEVFFWGYQSRKELNAINEILSESKKMSPSASQHLRSFLAHCMHDAIWVQKKYNMQKIIDQLHKNVLKSHSEGQKVVLMGHSAGSFVTYEYLIHKLRAGKIDFLTGKNENKYTCLDAVTKSKMAFLMSDGKFVKNPNEKQFQDAYNHIDEFTDLYCAPDNTILGIVNFGSPLSLFYSSQISQAIEETSAYKLSFVRYVQSHDMFILTVNFADDALGFPAGNNVSKSDIEMEFNTTLDDTGKGFIYNYSKVSSKITSAGAHFAYWKLPTKFSKMVRDAYIKGYKNFYEIY